MYRGQVVASHNMTGEEHSPWRCT